LLVLYRDFLSGQDLAPFFEFTTAYSGHLIGEKERGRWCPAFSTERLEVLLMNTDRQLSQIVQSEGFQNVAYAIRHATVIPQARKAKKQSGFQVRYGLGQRLARKANYAEDFVAELAAFVQEYNAENEQQFERQGVRFRKGVKTGDIEEIVRLVDEFGPKVVCNLLVAFGYARAPSEHAEPAQGELDTNLVSNESGDEDGENDA